MPTLPCCPACKYRFLVWGGLISSTFAMDNSVLNGFAQAARVFAGFFIVLQASQLADLPTASSSSAAAAASAAAVGLGGNM